MAACPGFRRKKGNITNSWFCHQTSYFILVTAGIARYQKELQTTRLNFTSFSKASDVIKTGLNHPSCQKSKLKLQDYTSTHVIYQERREFAPNLQLKFDPQTDKILKSAQFKGICHKDKIYEQLEGHTHSSLTYTLIKRPLTTELEILFGGGPVAYIFLLILYIHGLAFSLHLAVNIATKFFQLNFCLLI